MLQPVLIDDLRRLLVLADHERLTDAAAALRMSQPTLSRLLARVEDQLRARLVARRARGGHVPPRRLPTLPHAPAARLFERDARGVHVNPLGDIVLAAARDITARYDQLEHD